MRFEQEQAIKAFVEKAGFRATLIGVLLFIMEIIFGIVLAAIHYTKPISDAPKPPNDDDLLMPIIAVLGFIAFFVIPIVLFAGTRWIEKFLNRFPNNAEWLTKSNDEFPIHFHMLNAKYLQLALQRSAIADAPGIFGFIILVFQMNIGSGIFQPSWVTYTATSMMIWAMVLKATVIPTAGRLERYIIEKTSEQNISDTNEIDGHRSI
ncbi:MAG: hypothetical protein ABIH86_02480 [Planctomycetota bacterium]